MRLRLQFSHQESLAKVLRNGPGSGLAWRAAQPKRYDTYMYNDTCSWFDTHPSIFDPQDDTVNAAIWYIKNFLAPPADVFHPEIVARILWRTYVG
jgi:hypothetical protein